jgi:PAS domain S-box-containing protein
MATDQQYLPRPFRVVWIAIFLVTAFLVATTGYLHYQKETEAVAAEKSLDLLAVGSLKARQFSEWRRERLADAIRFAQGPALVGPTLQFIRTPNEPAARQNAMHMLTLNRKGRFYENTFLVAPDNSVLLTAERLQESLSPATLLAIKKAFELHVPALSGIYRTQNGKAHIDTAAPLCGENGEPFAATILTADASDFIDPLIRFWPTESTRSETLLVERDGDDIVFLNDVKGRPDNSACLRIPLSQNRLIEVKAVLGSTGVLQGKDYRGIDVLADVRPIPDSDWFLVTKIDRSEILAEVRSRAKHIVFFVGLGILLAAALTAVGYRRRQSVLYLNLYQVEKEQRTAQQKYRTILYSIGDAVIVTDDEGRVRQMNPVAEHLTGWKEEEAIDKPLDDIFHIINEETREPVENPVWRILREGQIVGLANHTVLISRDGTERPIADSGAPVHDEQSAMRGVVLIFRDQSVEHAAQKALQESERRLFTLMNNLPGMAYRCENDAFWTMRFISQGSLPLLGWSPADLVNNARVAYADLIHPEDRDFVRDTIAQAVLARQTFTIEYRIRTAAGGEKWVWERGCAIFKAGGAFESLEGFIIDISDRKLATEEQTKLERQLQQSQRIEAVGRLAGGVAHDFNNMLAVIVGTVELVMERIPASDALHSDLEEILKASRRSAALVKQLLAFASKQPIVPRVLNLNETISGMITMFGRMIGEDIGLEWTPGHSLWNVRMDPSQIDQILVNLIVNSRDAISGIGQVSIETHNVNAEALRNRLPVGAVSGDYVLIAVSDDGCGMTAEQQAHIFEPFFTTKEKGVGTGLGLSTVYGIVKQNRGFIKVFSEPGNGTRFSIFLPRDKQRAEPIEQDETDLPVPTTAPEKATILLVEDEPALLSLTTALIKRIGYTVLAAGGPLEALEMARDFKDPIDLLLTDVVMPEMSGRDLFRQLVLARPSIRCLFMSGYTADIIAQHGMLQDDLHFLQKPFTKDALAANLNKALSKK